MNKIQNCILFFFSMFIYSCSVPPPTQKEVEKLIPQIKENELFKKWFYTIEIPNESSKEFYELELTNNSAFPKIYFNLDDNFTKFPSELKQSLINNSIAEILTTPNGTSFFFYLDKSNIFSKQEKQEMGVREKKEVSYLKLLKRNFKTCTLVEKIEAESDGNKLWKCVINYTISSTLSEFSDDKTEHKYYFLINYNKDSKEWDYYATNSNDGYEDELIHKIKQGFNINKQ